MTRVAIDRMAARWRSASFRARLLIPLLVLLGILVGGATALSVRSYETRVEQEFLYRIQFAQDVARPPLSKALWDLFEPAADEVLSGLSNLEGFVSARVLAADGDVFAALTEDGHSADDVRASTFPLIWDGETLGSFELVVSWDGPASAIRNFELRALAIAVLVFAIFAVAISWVAQSIARPLSDLAKRLPSLGQTDAPIPHRDRGDAVGELARGLSAFGDTLRERDRLRAEEARVRAEVAEREAEALAAKADAAASEARTAQQIADRRNRELLQAESRDQERQDAATVLGFVSRNLTVALENLSSGRLDAPILDTFPDEYEPLRRAMNMAIDELGAAVRQIAGATGDLDRTSGQVHQEADALSDRAEHDADKARVSAGALESIADRVNATAGMTRSANEQMASVRDALSSMRDRMAESTAAMTRIDDAARTIVRIADTNDDIAHQTNLLSLNAAVEAAHAGKAGRGFAVVAAEVRQLAQKSASSAGEVRALVSECRSAITDAVAASTATDEALASVDRNVGDVGVVVGRIEAAGRLDAEAAEMLQGSARDLDAAIAKNADTANALRRSVETLRRSVASVGGAVNRFTLPVAEKGDPAEKPVEEAPGAGRVGPIELVRAG